MMDRSCSVCGVSEKSWGSDADVEKVAATIPSIFIIYLRFLIYLTFLFNKKVRSIYIFK